jgi:hypothetical protein
VEAMKASIYVEVGGLNKRKARTFTTVTNIVPQLRDETARDERGVGESHKSHDSLILK